MSNPPTTPAGPVPGPDRRARLVLGGILLLALALRVAHAFFLRASPYFDAPTMDGAYHLEWARAVAAGERFREGEPFFRAPLYPWFLGAAWRLTGGSFLGVRLVQALLGVLTVFLTLRLGRRVGGAAVGTIAGLLAATSWVLVHFDGELLIPTLAVPLNLLALLATLRLADDRAPRRAAAAGVLWGVAALARPNVLLFLPCLALWLLVRGRGRGRWRGSWSAPLALTLGTLAPVLPVTAYNKVVGDDWVLISSLAGVNLWIGNNPESDGSTAVVPGTRAGWWEGYHDAIALAERAEGRELRPSEVSSHYAGRARRWVLEEPGAALRHFLWKTRLLVLNAEISNNLDPEFFALHHDPLLRWSPVRFDLLLGLGLVGLGIVLRRGERFFPVWGFLVVYAGSVLLFFVNSRYRVPLLPILMVLAAQALVSLVRAWRRGERGQVAAGAAVALAVVLFSNTGLGRLIPSAANGHVQLAQAALRDGDRARAVEHLERAIDLHEDHPYAPWLLARAVRESGDPVRAEKVLREAVARREAIERRTGRRSAGLPELRAELVDVLVDLGRAQEALQRATTYLGQDPRQPLLHFGRGRALVLLGRLPEAARAMEEALALDPSLAFVRDALGQIRAALGG